MSHALRKLAGVVHKSNTIVVFINQIRMKIGIVFGNPETTTGGNALKFYSSIRVEIRRSAQIKQGDKVIGNKVKVKIVKNKVAPPFKRAEFDIMYNEGISVAGDVLEVGVETKVIEKSGNTHSYKGEKLGVGREVVKTFLREHPKTMMDIREAIIAKLKAEDDAENVKVDERKKELIKKEDVK
jgi:recombination protein RecA